MPTPRDDSSSYHFTGVDYDDRNKKNAIFKCASTAPLEPFIVLSWSSRAQDPRQRQDVEQAGRRRKGVRLHFLSAIPRLAANAATGSNFDYLSRRLPIASQQSCDADVDAVFADLDHAHPEVADECKAWGVWVIKELGAGPSAPPLTSRLQCLDVLLVV